MMRRNTNIMRGVEVMQSQPARTRFTMSILAGALLAGAILGAGLLASQNARAQTDETANQTDAAPLSEAELIRREIAHAPVLDRLHRSGASLTPMGRAFGLSGWLVEADDTVSTLYVTPDGRGVVMGILFSPDGVNETAAQLNDLQRNGVALNQLAPQAAEQNHFAPPFVPQDETIGDKILNELSMASYIGFGEASAPIIYVIVDPNCPYCKSYWRDLAGDALAAGRLQVRLVPVAVLGEDSADKAARLLSDDDPHGAWEALVAGDSSALDQPASAHAMAAIEANRSLMRRWNLEGVPFSIYRGHAGGDVKLLQGAPESSLQVVNEIVLPAPVAETPN